MKPTDLKIRFADDVSETWLERFLPEILKFEWKEQPIGINQFKSFAGIRAHDNKKLAQLSFYRTKTQRVVFISAKEAFR